MFKLLKKYWVDVVDFLITTIIIVLSLRLLMVFSLLLEDIIVLYLREHIVEVFYTICVFFGFLIWMFLLCAFFRYMYKNYLKRIWFVFSKWRQH